jgi:HSP20 family protein
MLPDFFEEIKHLEKEIQDVLQKFQEGNNLYMSSKSGFLPPMDIFEKENNIVAVLDVPGIEPSSLKISYLNRTVTITGEKSKEVNQKGRHYHCIERHSGDFIRKFRVLKPVDIRNSKSILKNGVLTVKLSLLKEENLKPVIIEVEQLD